MFRRLFIANRGEVAARIARTCRAMGITPVFAVSEADRTASYVRGQETVCIGPATAAQSYLDPVRLVQAAVQSRCSALHPGWGFLSEDPMFPSLCAAHGLVFVGPTAGQMARLGEKIRCRLAMASVGLSVLPGSDAPVRARDDLRETAARIGYPVLLKAKSGGGGKGLRVVRDEGALLGAWEEAAREAKSSFGDPDVYVERFLQGCRHVEVQVVADRYGNVCVFGERDCTVQRRHQKLIEEKPCPALSPGMRASLHAQCLEAVAKVGYFGAGTLEFLLDGDEKLWFIEFNTRLQVEHGISEMVTGHDLVAWSIAVAAGERIASALHPVEGHALEVRINAEDPLRDFAPSPGTLRRWTLPETVNAQAVEARSGTAGWGTAKWATAKWATVQQRWGTRVDTHLQAGDTLSPWYDSLMAKLMVHAPDRSSAIAGMVQALSSFACEGVHHTGDFAKALVAGKAFATLDYSTESLPALDAALAVSDSPPSA